MDKGALTGSGERESVLSLTHPDYLCLPDKGFYRRSRFAFGYI
jgi:hypothetical protein